MYIYHYEILFKRNQDLTYSTQREQVFISFYVYYDYSRLIINQIKHVYHLSKQNLVKWKLM